MNNIFYTYIYLDPRKSGTYQYGDYKFDFEPFYVGMGKNKRCLDHLFEAKNLVDDGKNKHKIYKIRKILKDNLQPIIIKVKENITDQEASNLEIWLIWAIGRSDLELGSLTNLTDGEKGPTNPGIETRKRMSDSHKGKKLSKDTKIKLSRLLSGENHYNFGKHRSEETKQKISKGNLGKTLSKETKQKMSIAKQNPSEETRLKFSLARKGKTHTPEVKEKLRSANLGKVASKETRKKLSDLNKGENNPNFGKKRSFETRRKIGFSNKGEKHYNFGKKLSIEQRTKMSETHRNLNRIKKESQQI